MRLFRRTNIDELVTRCQSGEPDSQRLLYERFAGKFLIVCKRYLKNEQDAEDALQDSFVKIFDKITSYQSKGSFEGWMRTIVVNQCLRVLENQKRKFDEVELQDEERKYIPPPNAGEFELSELLGVLNELPDGYRTVFNLYVMEGYRHAEIALRLGISEGTSKSQLARARKFMQNRLMEIAFKREERGRSVG